jgi:hypothetical protein
MLEQANVVWIFGKVLAQLLVLWVARALARSVAEVSVLALRASLCCAADLLRRAVRAWRHCAGLQVSGQAQRGHSDILQSIMQNRTALRALDFTL